MKFPQAIAIQGLLHGAVFTLTEARPPNGHGRPPHGGTAPHPGGNVATIRNFNVKDLLSGNDGMPPSPFAPWVEGQPVLALDDAGNVIEQHETSISFFDGTYYLYTSKWACGQLSFFSGLLPNISITAPKYPSGDYGGLCGFGIYSSTDLMSWHHERDFVPDVYTPSVQKPHVMYSEATGKYTFWFKSGSNFADENGFAVMTSDSPAGPFTGTVNATGSHLAHDFDVAQGPDGSWYLVSDVWSFEANTDRTVPPVWDVYVQKLNPELTGTVNTTDTSVLIMKDADFEAIGIFYKNGYWYLTSGETCANCAVPTQYVMSKDGPFGPYVNLEGQSSADGSLKHGSRFSDGCMGQSKAVSTLPAEDGDTVILATSLLYRTSPSNLVSNNSLNHGNNAQAIASTAYYPLSFDSEHRIEPVECAAEVSVPLARGLQPARRKIQPPYQPDCRITKASSFQQHWAAGLRVHNTLEMPVWQQTFDLGPFNQGGPVNNAPLEITVDFKTGPPLTMSIAASNVSWSPEKVKLDVGGRAPVSKVTLASAVSNGCYGVVVEPRLPGTVYGSALASGNFEDASLAQMVVVTG